MKLTLALLLLPACLLAQSIQAEYDKTRDFTQYKTFRFGPGQVITPKDQRQFDEKKLEAWIKTSIREEFREKGLIEVDSAADLIVTYAIGSSQRLDMQNLGPMGGAPGQDSRIWSRDYTLSSFIIDLNDRANHLVWRVNGETGATTADAARQIDEFVAKGFRKFSIRPKKQKRQN
jgi:hypothetical protein